MPTDTAHTAAPILAFASDHAGFELKGLLIAYVRARGYTVLDLGTHDGARVDYPDNAAALAHCLLDKKAALGVGICGTGIGISIALNRFAGIRAALCHNAETAQLARQHNDANVLCLGGRVLSFEQAAACLDAFLDATFEGGRHALRVAKMECVQ